MGGMKKKQSKRLSTRKRCKIVKKVREHNRKAAKLATTKTKRRKKDPGVPNDCPFKEQVLKEAGERRQKIEEERQRQKDRKKKNREQLVNNRRGLSSLVKDAASRAQEFEVQNDSKNGDTVKTYAADKTTENSLSAYYKEFKKVVTAADIIIQVLDARDPLGSRCAQVERTILQAGSQKRLVLLLNKIDLVPKENVENWLTYLRNEFPTVAFKASTQEQSDKLSQCKVSIAKANDDLRQSSKCLGADMLMKLLANYCRNKEIKTSITVGIVGFPNTGKSSVINSLKRSKACSTGSTPGVTKSMQTIQLDKHIRLLDSPGIVMTSTATDAQLILRNCVKLETVTDPVVPVQAIMQRCSKDKIMLLYKVSDFEDCNEFLVLLAQKMGRLKKGGIPDINKAAKVVLQDWNNGKIRYFTEPPEDVDSHVSADIVSQMSKEFDIGALITEEQTTLNGLQHASTSDMRVESMGPTECIDSDDADMDNDCDTSDEDINDDVDRSESEVEQDIEMDSDKPVNHAELENVVVNAAEKNKRSKKSLKKDNKEKVNVEMILSGNQQLGKKMKMASKLMKKKRRRAEVLGSKLSDALDGALSGISQTTEQYDFEEHFT